MSLFGKLFRPDHVKDDGLTQGEREAIADALHFCMYADNRIAEAEIRTVESWVSTLTWDPKLSYSAYESRSIAAARQAKENADYRKDFLASIGKRLTSANAKNLAVSLANRVMSADGQKTDKEDAIVAEIRAAAWKTKS